MEIYLHQDGERAGPFTLENVQGRLEGGQLTVSDAAWFEGCSDWVTVQDVPGIMLPGGDHLVEVATVPPFDAYQGDEPYVFISYAHKDAAVVYDEIKRLHEAGSNVWYDEGIEASNEWPEEIAQAVVRCSVFLVFVSPRATASVNCRNEINMALNKNKPFLAIYLEETQLPLGLELRMGDLQAILRYKLPQDRYQRKAQDAIEQLLGKKPSRSQTRPPIPQQTGATHEPEPAEQAVQTTTSTSKPRRKGLAVALASVLLIACGALGYLFLGDDGEEATETSTATFTPGQPWTVPTASIEMIWCEPGTFMMGSPESEVGRELDFKGRKTKYNETKHQVKLPQGFYLGKYEVTQAQWKKVMGTSPSKFFGENRPVEQVNWPEAVRFCQELSLMERKSGRLPDGWEYVLPTEAQWEYACRAGTTTAFAFGDSLSSKQANFNGTKPYGGAATGPNLRQTTDVGSYAANPWGFYDMHGNVWEWCADLFGTYSTGPVTDPFGVASGSSWVLRGGSWLSTGAYLRSAKRFTNKPGYRVYYLGFRPSLQQTKVEQPKVPVPGQPWTVPTASIDMLWCKPGTFLMGSPESEEGRELDDKGRINKYNEPNHPVTLTKGFYLGKYEVTQAQWKKVMETSPSKFFGDDRPVEQVSWTDSKDFCWKLTVTERKAGCLPDGWEYTLPTEAQWEYACRAGTTTVFSFGDSLSSKQANFKGIEPYGGAEAGPFLERTTDVGSYAANPWGFFDMHGNVREWCADRRGNYPTGAVTDPTGLASGSSRVRRGGSWAIAGAYLRSAARTGSTPGHHYRSLGFRLCLQQVGK